MRKRKLIWMRLDNAAKIFPAAKRRYWNNIFRVSATLKEDVDPIILQRALDRVVPRFPSMAVGVRHGMFWYYLEQVEHAPQVVQDSCYPLSRMKFSDIKKCAFRVLYYKRRIAVEFFHALTDGSGGMIFLKTLVAQYLRIAYKADIPCENGILDIDAKASPAELEDSFLKYSGSSPYRKKDPTTYRMKGTFEKDRFRHIITGSIPVEQITGISKAHNTTVTLFITAVLLETVIEFQKLHVRRKSYKPVRVTIPVNLRKIFGSETLRNFALCVNAGVDPCIGEYTLDEIIDIIKHQMALEVTKKNFAGLIAANVNQEKHLFMRLVPLFIKNFVMSKAYVIIGESKGCITLSNLGLVELPSPMNDYVEAMDFILSPQISYPNNCSAVSYNGKLRISLIRSIEESEFERMFFTRLVDMGLEVTIESNER